jgi:hypothetical protein
VRRVKGYRGTSTVYRHYVNWKKALSSNRECLACPMHEDTPLELFETRVKRRPRCEPSFIAIREAGFSNGILGLVVPTTSREHVAEAH